MANIVSFASLRSKNNEEEEEKDESNRFYVGGANSKGGGSGLSVIGGDDTTDHMANIIAKARARSQERIEKNENTHTITFYREGFTVDDGPYRSRTDPENFPFLQAIDKGFVPKELEKDKNEQVHINIKDNRNEDYKPPISPSYTAFSGNGQIMGSSNIDNTKAVIQSNKNQNTEKPVVDETKPKTIIQIRLHNGQRLRETLNLSHTIHDIQQIISLNGVGGVPYILLTGFPPKPIVNMDQTISDAKLEGASITQKLA